ncbi:MAG: DNA polymerase III subunit delta [Bacteroidota bacterium]
MTPEDFHSALRQRQFRSVYFLYGEEDFLIDEMVQSFINTAVDEGTRGFNLDIVYGNDLETKDVVALASAYPMMAERRVVVVRDFDRLANNEQLIGYIEQPSETTSLLLLAEKVDMRRKPYVTLKTKAEIIECRPLRDDKVPDWIISRVKERGKVITSEGARLLHAHVGNSLRDLNNEIEKLFIAVGERRTIEIADVTDVVGLSKVYNIFELTRMIGTRNLARSIEIMERMLQAGEQATMMVVMITRHFTTLWKIAELRSKKQSDKDIAGKTGVNPYFIKEYLSQLDEYPVSRIEANFESLLRADEELKSTQIDTRVVMTVLLHELIHE